jgi:hypothetical protein
MVPESSAEFFTVNLDGSIKSQRIRIFIMIYGEFIVIKSRTLIYDRTVKKLSIVECGVLSPQRILFHQNEASSKPRKNT